MKILLWLRALMDFNFYNWNSNYSLNNLTRIVLHDKKEIDDFHIGKILRVEVVNRTTGQIHVRILE